MVFDHELEHFKQTQPALLKQHGDGTWVLYVNGQPSGGTFTTADAAMAYGFTQLGRPIPLGSRLLAKKLGGDQPEHAFAA
jgi:hypothetical protein